MDQLPCKFHGQISSLNIFLRFTMWEGHIKNNIRQRVYLCVHKLKMFVNTEVGQLEKFKHLFR